MIKTWYEEYEKIKDKAVVVYPYKWDSFQENRYYERRKRICLQTL